VGQISLIVEVAQVILWNCFMALNLIRIL